MNLIQANSTWPATTLLFLLKLSVNVNNLKDPLQMSINLISLESNKTFTDTLIRVPKMSTANKF